MGKEKNEVKFKDLHWVLKVGIIGGFAWCISFIMGLLFGLAGL